ERQHERRERAHDCARRQVAEHVEGRVVLREVLCDGDQHQSASPLLSTWPVPFPFPFPLPWPFPWPLPFGSAASAFTSRSSPITREAFTSTVVLEPSSASIAARADCQSGPACAPAP